MRFFSNFLKRIKDKIGFRIMTKEEYELFLRKKNLDHKSSFLNSSFSINDVNTNNPSSIHNEINPATGLPMVGGVDAGGNSYGFDSSSSFDSINPATGLPMVGGVDTGGNPYGFDSSSSFDHSFQDLGNSYHNDFHHD